MNSLNDQNAWIITPEDMTKYESQFYSLNPIAGFLSGEQAKTFFLKSGLTNQVLGMIWYLSDVNMDGKMDKHEFSIAMHLIKRCYNSLDLPLSLPPSLLFHIQLPPGMVLPNQMPISQIASSSSPPHSVIPPYNTLPYHPSNNSQAAKSSAYSTTSRGSISLSDWVITPAQRLKYKQVFDTHDNTHKGYLTGLEAKGLLSQSGLTHTVLAKIWCLADIDADGNLSSDEFCVAMHLIDQAKSGFVLPASLPQDLIPPSQRKIRRASEVSSAAVNSVAVVAINSVANSNNMGVHGGGRALTPALDLNPGANNSDSPIELEPSKIVTFEDKRKENFNQGQAELEKRRQMLRQLQVQESETRLASERVEFEKKEKIRVEQETKKQQEWEMQLERQRQVGVEKEQERMRLLEQKEAARRELNRQRQAEWQKQRQEQLVAERSKCQAALDQLKQQTAQQRQSLESLRDKKRESVGKVDDTRKSLTEMSSIIDSIKLLSLSKCTEIDVISSELEEVEMKMVAVEQESLRLKKHPDFSQNSMDDAWRDLKRERDVKEEAMAERRVKLEIVGESCGKKEEVIRKMEEQVKVKEKMPVSVVNQKPKLENLFENFESIPSQIPWQQKPTETSSNLWEDLKPDTASSLEDDAWADVHAKQDSDQKASWTADFNSTFKSIKGSDLTASKTSPKRYKALYNFEARSHDELSLFEGDVVMVDADAQVNSEPGWMIGTKSAHTGCFPEAYVALVEDATVAVDDVAVVDATVTNGRLATEEKRDERNDKDVFSTLTKAFEEAFSAKKSPVNDANATSTEDQASVQPFHALNEAFTTAFATDTNTKSNFDSDFSTLNFDQSAFESSSFDPLNLESSSFEPSSFPPANTISIEVSKLTNMSHKPPSSMDSAIKDILEKSRKTPVSPTPFAGSSIVKTHSPSPLTTTSKSLKVFQPSNNLIIPSTTTMSTTSLTTTIANTTTLTTTNTFNNTFSTTDTKNDIEDTVYNNIDEIKNSIFNKTNDTKDNTLLPNKTASYAAANTTTAAYTIANTPLAVPQQLVEAVYTWKAKKPNHLSFSKGDVINKISQQDLWCFGEVNGEKGWFPASYVKTIGASDSPFPEQPPNVETMPSEAQSNGSHVTKNALPTLPFNQLSLSNNDQSSVTMESNEDAVGNSYEALEEFIAVAIFNYESSVPGDLPFKKGDVFVAQATDVDWWSGNTDDGRSGIFPSSYVRKMETMKESLSAKVPNQMSLTSGKLLDKKPEIATAIADYEATGPEQLSVKAGQLVDVRKKGKNGWWEGEIQVKGQKRRGGWFPANYVKLLGEAGKESLPSLNTVPSTSPGNVISACTHVVALYTYTGQTDGDLSFTEGEKIRLVQKCSDDWWEGEVNGRVGIFPATYVAIVTGDVTAST